MRHHVSEGEEPAGAGDLVPLDEGTRDCGEWSTTSVREAAHPGPGTWCPWTKE